MTSSGCNWLEGRRLKPRRTRLPRPLAKTRGICRGQ